jgi:hypothetical protein
LQNYNFFAEKAKAYRYKHKKTAPQAILLPLRQYNASPSPYTPAQHKKHINALALIRKRFCIFQQTLKHLHQNAGPFIYKRALINK